jgi:ABC-2 type transport system permease protein
MSSMRKLLAVETKLFLREPPAIFWALAFPALLLAALGGVFPGFTEPVKEFGGLRLIDVYLPISLVVAMATVGVTGLPPVLASYRQYGILRRFAVTPVGPSRLLSTQLLVHLGAAIVATVLAVGVAVIAFDVPFPKDPVMFGLVLLLAAAAMFSIGLLIGALAPTVSSGQGIAMAAYFPMLLFAGVYFPRETMPDGLRAVSDLSPAGAAVQAMKDAWFGATPDAGSLLVMALVAVAAGLLAVRFLRWD